jgi:D-glycero-D-manno-heptose 1,7-bisphosphate phosphatase
MVKAVFLDRDGTVNEEMGYINHPSRLKIFDFAITAVKQLKDAGFKIIILTNQSGVARGYFDENVLLDIHAILLKHFSESNASIDKIYYCPHHKEGIIPKYKKDCDCRKPKPGMLIKAKEDFNISLENSYLVGDRYKDIEFAQQNRIKSIMVLTGYGLGEYSYQKNQWKTEPDFVCDNLLKAAGIICQNELSY